MRSSCRIALCIALAVCAAGPAHAEPRGRGARDAEGNWNPIEIRLRVPRATEIRRAARDAWNRIETVPSNTFPDAEPRRQTAPPEAREPVEMEPPAETLEAEAEALPEPEPAMPEAPAEVVPAAVPETPVLRPERRVSATGAGRVAIVLGLLAVFAVLALLLLRRSTPGRSAAPAELVPPRRETAPTLPRVAVAAAADPALAADLEPSPAPAGGRYEILGELGRGGMGVVYRARDTRLDRVVALKRLPDHLRKEERFVEMLLREARSAARLNHRNIVTVYDVDHEDGSWFITMELLEGGSLSEIVRSRGRMTTRAALWVADQALAGLGYAHARGVIHRDVKPANLFVTRDRSVKLMDFGLARIAEEARRKKTLIGGTPDYMAPEQATGQPVDARADLYALGATLFELLTGAVPFADGDPLPQHRDTPPPDPRARVAEIPEALAALVLALLAKRPDDRPSSAEEVAKQLRSISQSDA